MSLLLQNYKPNAAGVDSFVCCWNIFGFLMNSSYARMSELCNDRLGLESRFQERGCSSFENKGTK